jgi:hypothetical protein
MKGEDYILPGIGVAGSLLLSVLLYQAQMKNIAYDKATGLIGKGVRVAPTFLHFNDGSKPAMTSDVTVLVDGLSYGPNAYPYPTGLITGVSSPLDVLRVSSRVWFDPKLAGA